MTGFHPLHILIAFFALLSFIFLGFARRAFKRKRYIGGFNRTFVGFFFLLLTSLCAWLSFGLWGYKALTLEQAVATVNIRETAPQRFNAEFMFTDGTTQQFELAGDQLYLDAKLVKWHPYANLLGFRSLYELERVSGRYFSLDDEQTEPRTLYSLAKERRVDVFDAQPYLKRLSFLMDAEYGSASFQALEDGANYAVTVSTSGLIIRKLE